MPTDHLTIAVLHPLLSQPLGDEGNALVLASRAEARGITTDLRTVHDAVRIDGPAVLLLGGAADARQPELARRLAADPGFRDAVGAGAAVFAVDAGFGVLAHSFVDITGAPTDGLGLIDGIVHSDDPADGPVVTQATTEPSLPPGSGYESHRGRITLGNAARPLWRLELGIGNDGATDGAVQDNVFATWMHGPVLARNPELADTLLERALGRPMAPLPDPRLDGLARSLREQHLREDRSDPTGWGGRIYGTSPMRAWLRRTMRAVRGRGH